MLDELKKLQSKKNKISIFCCGEIGKALFRIFKICGLDVDCFFDNNPSLYEKEIVENCFCRDPDLVLFKDDYYIMIGILDTYYDQVLESVNRRGFKNIIRFTDLFDDIICNYTDIYEKIIKYFENYRMLDLFYVRYPNKNINAKKQQSISKGSGRIAVYTSIFDKYDNINIPKIHPDNIDYFFVSDIKPDNLAAYVWIDAKTIVPNDIQSPIKRNRYIKMFPHKIFPNYDYSIYVDGSIQIKEDISSFLGESKAGISAFIHPRRDCLFYEAATIVNYRRVISTDVFKQMKRYLSEGMPLHYGLFEMGVLAREHHKDICKKLMEDWWAEFNNGVQRDQLCFMYVMWKNGLGVDSVSKIGDDIRKSNYIYLNKHKNDSYKVRNTYV